MSKIHQAKVSMHAVPSVPDSGASQGARRATEDAPESASPPVPPALNSEVVAHARRRSFSNATKRRILEAVDRCTNPARSVEGKFIRRTGKSFRLTMATVGHRNGQTMDEEQLFWDNAPSMKQIGLGQRGLAWRASGPNARRCDCAAQQHDAARRADSVGILDPSGMPRAVVGPMNMAINSALRAATERQRMAGVGSKPQGAGADEVSGFMRREMGRWMEVVDCLATAPISTVHRNIAAAGLWPLARHWAIARRWLAARGSGLRSA